MRRDQVLHRVSVSVSCQTSRLSFTRRPPRAELSARRYALITARPPQRGEPQNSDCMGPVEQMGACARVCVCNILNMPSPGVKDDGTCKA